MAAQAKTLYSEAEYLALDRAAEFKSEYHDGVVVAFAGASRQHVSIVGNLTYLLVGQLRGKPCRPYAVELRVKIPTANAYVYPDLSVVCGEPAFEDADLDTLLNPTAIFEVLSPSTELMDRNRKFDYYSSLATVTDYLLVSQDEAKIAHYSRQPGETWLLTVARGLDSQVIVQSIACSLPLAEVYYDVDVPKAAL